MTNFLEIEIVTAEFERGFCCAHLKPVDGMILCKPSAPAKSFPAEKPSEINSGAVGWGEYAWLLTTFSTFSHTCCGVLINTCYESGYGHAKVAIHWSRTSKICRHRREFSEHVWWVIIRCLDMTFALLISRYKNSYCYRGWRLWVIHVLLTLRRGGSYPEYLLLADVGYKYVSIFKPRLESYCTLDHRLRIHERFTKPCVWKVFSFQADRINCF